MGLGLRSRSMITSSVPGFSFQVPWGPWTLVPDLEPGKGHHSGMRGDDIMLLKGRGLYFLEQ